jgi:hypothetical protein
VTKLGRPEAARVERIQEFVVTQMGRGKHKRHKPIMADESCAPPPLRKPAATGP